MVRWTRCALTSSVAANMQVMSKSDVHTISNVTRPLRPGPSSAIHPCISVLKQDSYNAGIRDRASQPSLPMSAHGMQALPSVGPSAASAPLKADALLPAPSLPDTCSAHCGQGQAGPRLHKAQSQGRGGSRIGRVGHQQGVVGQAHHVKHPVGEQGVLHSRRLGEEGRRKGGRWPLTAMASGQRERWGRGWWSRAGRVGLRLTGLGWSQGQQGGSEQPQA